MKVKSEEVKTVTEHHIVSELPRVEGPAVYGSDIGSAYRRSEPASAAWQGLDGWPMEGRLSHGKIELLNHPPQEEQPINYGNVPQQVNLNLHVIQQHNGPINTNTPSRKASRTRHGYDYHQDRKKQEILEAKLEGLGVGFLQGSRQLSEAAKKYKLTSWTDQLDQEFQQHQRKDNFQQIKSNNWPVGARIESLRHSVEAPKQPISKNKNLNANLVPLRHSVALPKANIGTDHISGVKQKKHHELPNLVCLKPQPIYPMIHYSPRSGTPIESKRNQNYKAQSKNHPQAQFLQPLSDLKLPQDLLETFGKYDSSSQPRMFDQIKQGGQGQPVFCAEFGYQNVKTMRKHQIDLRMHSQFSMKRSRQMGTGMRLKHTTGNDANQIAPIELQGVKKHNRGYSKDDVASYMRNNEKQLLQIQQKVKDGSRNNQNQRLEKLQHQTAKNPTCLYTEPISPKDGLNYRQGSNQKMVKINDFEKAIGNNLQGYDYITDQKQESKNYQFNEDQSSQGTTNRIKMGSFMNTSRYKNEQNNTINQGGQNGVQGEFTPSVQIKPTNTAESFKFQLKTEAISLAAPITGDYQSEYMQFNSGQSSIGITNRSTFRGQEGFSHKISRQQLIDMGYDPTAQHLSQLKQLFRKKFKLQNNDTTSYVGSTADSTGLRATPVSSEMDRVSLIKESNQKKAAGGVTSPIKSIIKGEQELTAPSEFNSKLGAFAQLLMQSENEIQSPLQKSKDYKKIKEEIERLDRVINQRKGIVPSEKEQIKLGRGAARQEHIRKQEEERSAQLNPIKEQIALKIMEVTLVMNKHKLKIDSEEEQDEDFSLVIDRKGNTWPETQILINSIIENMKSQEEKEGNLNRLKQELETLQKRLELKMTQFKNQNVGLIQVKQCQSPRKRINNQQFSHPEIKESDDSINVDDLPSGNLKSKQSLLLKFQKAANKVVDQKRKGKYEILDKVMSNIRKENLFNTMDELLPGPQNLKMKYRDIRRNIWTNDFIEKLQDDQKAFADFNYRKDWIKELNNTFGAKVKTLEFYKEAKSMNNVPKRIVELKSIVEMVDVEDEDSSEAYQDEVGHEEIIQNQKLIRKYFASSMNRPEVPMPTFSRISKNTLFVIESRITQGMAESLREFLEAVDKDKNPSNVVQKLALTDNTLSDNAFATILQGIQAQKLQTSIKPMAMHSLVYSKNEFGKKSFLALQPLLREIQELDLNQIQIKPGDLLELLEQCSTSCITRLAKLSLSKINLSEVPISDKGITDTLCELIGSCHMLRHLDLSWCSLTPKQLTLIFSELLSKKEEIRSLNLSYNVSISVPDIKQCEGATGEIVLAPMAKEFLSNLYEFLSDNQFVTHLDFSGMGLQRDHLLKISHLVQEPSSTLLSLHLSDNGIRACQDLLMDVLDAFDIEDDCLEPKQRIQGLTKLTQQHNDEKCCGILKRVAKDHFKSITEGHSADFEQQMILIEQCRQVTKSRLEKLPDTKSGIGGTLGLANALHLSQLQHHDDNSHINQAEHSGGDSFVVTRQINHPELIFNQNPLINGYFDLHGSDSWKLSLKGDCYICDKHKYSLIFFDQTKTKNSDESNGDLVEIKDKKQLTQIKEALFENTLTDDYKTPMVCGSIVNESVFAGDKVNFNFKRKLKMLRGDIFSLLNVSQSSDFASTFKQSNQIQQGIISLCENQSQNLCFKEMANHSQQKFRKNKQGSEDELRQMFCQRLEGWELFMKDFCIENQITDLSIINLPTILKPCKTKEVVLQQPVPNSTLSLEQTNVEKKETIELVDTLVQQSSIITQSEEAEIKKESNSQVYAYAAFLKPGMHQFIIYCPETHRAFCKQIVIDINGKDFYPEYPYTVRRKKKKPQIKRKNVWAAWKEDSHEMQRLALYSDLKNGCEPERFVKDPNQIEQCKQILEDNFEQLHVMFLEMSSDSDQYPEIDSSAFLEAVLANQDKLPEGSTRITRAQAELAFLSATRNDKAGRMKGALCRGEFFEVILRLSIQTAPQGSNVANHLPVFIKDQTDIAVAESEIMNDRTRIRSNAAINQVLWDNKATLQKLYAHFKDGKSFTFSSVDKYLSLLNQSDEKHSHPFISKPLLTKLFRMSQMTVYRDKKNSWKYSQLAYVEFLELTTRASLKHSHSHEQGGDHENGFTMNDEQLVYHLIETLHERAAKQKIIDPEITVLEPFPNSNKDDSD